MGTVLTISFVVLCFSEMIVFEASQTKSTLMKIWRGLLVLSGIGCLVSIIYLFDFIDHVAAVVITGFLSIIGALLSYLLLCVIAWILEVDADTFIDFLTKKR